jgi:hypothetical protein
LPCLIMYNNDHENQSKQIQKFERSNTLLRWYFCFVLILYVVMIINVKLFTFVLFLNKDHYYVERWYLFNIVHNKN